LRGQPEIGDHAHTGPGVDDRAHAGPGVDDHAHSWRADADADADAAGSRRGGADRFRAGRVGG
jgi:hypothetical protein